MHQASPSLRKSVTNPRQNADKITTATGGRSLQRIAIGSAVDPVVSGRDRLLLIFERPEPDPGVAGPFACHKSLALI
jgi:hypothetical protein